MIARIQNTIRNYSKFLSIICPLLSVLVLSGMYILTVGPMRDIDFLYLYIAIIFAAAFPLFGLRAAIMLKANSDAKGVRMMSNAVIASNILLLCVDMVFCIIIGLVGTTGSY